MLTEQNNSGRNGSMNHTYSSSSHHLGLPNGYLEFNYNLSGSYTVVIKRDKCWYCDNHNMIADMHLSDSVLNVTMCNDI